MAFQIKKDLHLNTGIYLKLLDDPTNAKTEEDKFGNTKYTLPIEMAGHDITDGSGVKWFKNAEGQWIELRLGKQTDFEFSDALYKKLAGNPSGSTVQVMLKEMEGKQGKYAGWTVMPMSSGAQAVSDAQLAIKSQKTVSNSSLGITWGMCMNNATQICINRWSIDGINKEVSIANQIEDIAGNLMDVAVNGLERWKKKQHELDQNSAPNDELPF